MGSCDSNCHKDFGVVIASHGMSWKQKLLSFINRGSPKTYLSQTTCAINSIKWHVTPSLWELHLSTEGICLAYYYIRATFQSWVSRRGTLRTGMVTWLPWRWPQSTGAWASLPSSWTFWRKSQKSQCNSYALIGKGVSCCNTQVRYTQTNVKKFWHLWVNWIFLTSTKLK